MKTKATSLILACSLLTACASTPKEQYTPDVQDPYQTYNRAMFKFNDVIYQAFLVPSNAIYTTVAPVPVRNSVRNVFRNIALVPDLANDALQWNWRYFAKDTVRLVLNSTLGLLGIFDVAGGAGIPWHPQGFGYTFAKWGGPDAVSEPAYLVIPFFGPSTISDGLGMILDAAASPITYINPPWISYTMAGVYGLQSISDQLPQYRAITSTALDPYVAVREAYLQNRAYNILQIKYDGNIPQNVQLNEDATEGASTASPALSSGASPAISPAMSPAVEPKS